MEGGKHHSVRQVEWSVKMTRQDILPVTFIVICMFVSFMSGRLSAPGVADRAPAQAVIARQPDPAPVAEPARPAERGLRDNIPVLPVEMLPTEARPPTTLYDVRVTKDVPRLSLGRPAVTTLPPKPEKIELEEEPEPMTRNPYLSDPGF